MTVSNARKIREEKQLSRLKVHQRSGINYLALTAIEQGKDISLMNACKMAVFFGVSIHQLIGESNRKPAPIRYSVLLDWLVGQKPAQGKLTGLEFHRRKKRLSKRTLAKDLGITTCTLINIERNGFALRSSAKEALRIAETLGVEIDDLLAMHSKDELEAGDRGAKVARTKNPDNPVDNYRVVHNLTCRELGRRMSRSYQAAINACERKLALKQHIEVLSAYEGITTAEFMVLYGSKE